MTDIPNFSMDADRYDQSTYQGRFLGFLRVIDPRCLFISEKDVEKANEVLVQFEKHKPNERQRLPEGVTDEKLWDARQVKDAVIHPATGEFIPFYLRMACFLPANVPIVAGMLNFTSLPATVFWQWANQSYNSALNYGNRSGADISISDVMKSYGIAVGVSCSIALGFRIFSSRGPKAWQNFTKIPFVVPYISVASAGSANVYFSRYKEIETGISVFDEDNTELGISKIAAEKGVYQTILSRAIGLPIPVLILPTILMKGVSSKASPRTRMMFELAAITVAIAIGLPMAIAIFPQKLELEAASLEEEFHNLKDKSGEKITKVFSNKGL